MNMKRTPIALAIGALLAAPLVMAQGTATESYAVNVTNTGSAAINSTLDSTTTQTTTVTANIPVSSKSQAVVDDKQLNSGNSVKNTAHDNNASVGDTAGNGASGNIGANAASGDNNMQDNAAAISAADAYFVFGASESRAMTTQVSSGNASTSEGSNNNAALGTSGTTNGGAFANAHGNIGINVASGNSNMQKNNLAISSAPSRASIASTQNVQSSSGNASVNSGAITTNGNGTTTGNITMSLAGGTGTYSGTHQGSTYIPPDQPPQHAFSTYQGTEAGTSTLAGTVSGTVTLPVALVVTNSQNNAHLQGSALAGASGNIGVNIAAGNNNLQNNSLSLAVSQAPVALPAGGLPTSTPLVNRE